MTAALARGGSFRLGAVGVLRRGILSEIVVLLSSNETHKAVQVCANLHERVVGKQDSWCLLVKLGCWALQEGAHSLAKVLNLVAHGVQVEEDRAKLAAVSLRAALLWTILLLGDALTDGFVVRVVLNDEVVDLLTDFVELVLAKVGIAIVGPSAVALETSWSNGSQWVQDELGILLLTSQPELQR